jgi:hypothetical protein
MGNKRYTDEDRLNVVALIEANCSDVEIVKMLGFNYGFVGKMSTDYWNFKMKEKQIDDYLKLKFPGRSVKQAAFNLGVSEFFVKRRVMYLKLDPNMIFETVNYFKTK